ncbi:hypothetical protein [Reichenbachiella sp.]|uniref:hypothetical protein n=1 Tax=Reichenbachiella sp. TaxID=2184521 RepID=UPI003BAF1385
MRTGEELELGFKYTFLRICLYVAALATFFQLMVSIIEFPGAFHVCLSSALFIISIVSMALWKNPNRYEFIVLLNASCWTIAYIMYWIGASGIHSAPAYVFFVLVIVFLIVLPKPYGYYYTVALCITCLMLTSFIPTGMNGQVLINDNLHYVLATQYLISLAMIIISLYFLKSNFDKERENNEQSNQTLIKLTAELVAKKKELLVKKEKTESLKKNLEQLVYDRTLQLEEKNEQLSQYAYDNAHILRGALCNILAIANLIQREQKDKKAKKAVERLNQKAMDLDQLVYQVNNLLK